MNKTLWVSIMLTFVVLSIIPLARFFSGVPIVATEAPYYHIGIAQQIMQYGAFQKEPLMVRPYSLDPYHFLLSVIGSSVNIAYAAVIISFVLGLLTIFFVNLIINKFRISEMKKRLILAILIISPPFIYGFSIPNSYCLPMFLIVLGSYLFMRKDRVSMFLSFAVFALVSIFNIANTFIALLVLLTYALGDKAKLKQFYYVAAMMLVFISVYHIPFYVANGLPYFESYSLQRILTGLISDIGGDMGFGLFGLILAGLGLYETWKNKKGITHYYILLILFIMMIFFPFINLYLNLIISVLAAYGVLRIINEKWQLKLVQTLTIILIACGLIFSSLSYVNKMVNAKPNKELFEGLSFLAEQSDGTVFSYYKNGFWIETIGGKPVVLDSNMGYLPEVYNRINSSEDLFYSRNLEKTNLLLDKYNISYIFIDKEMKEGEVWTKEQQGLLFLFRNSKIFKNLYSTDSIEIWQVIR